MSFFTEESKSIKSNQIKKSLGIPCDFQRRHWPKINDMPKDSVAYKGYYYELISGNFSYFENYDDYALM